MKRKLEKENREARLAAIASELAAGLEAVRSGKHPLMLRADESLRVAQQRRCVRVACMSLYLCLLIICLSVRLSLC